MKFAVEREIALGLFQKAGKVRPGASAILVPNLEKTLVEVSDEGQVFVTATNLLQIVRQECGSAEVFEPGSAVFPKASDLVQFLSACPDGQVFFDVQDSTLVIECGSASMVRQMPQVGSYPTIPDFSVVDSWHSVPAGLFAQDLKAVYPLAAAASEPNLAQVVVKDGAFYGSTGSAAHVQQVSGYKCPDLTVSASCVPLVRSLVLPSDVEFVEIGFAKNAVLFKIVGLTLLSYLPTYDYPDVVKPLVSTALLNDLILEIDRDEFLRAVLQVRGTADTFGAVYVQVSHGGEVSVRSKSQIGQTSTTLEGKFEHPDKEFVVSARAVIDALQCYPQQVCRIFLGDKDNAANVKDIPPVRMSASGGEGGNFVAVISQLRKDLL